MWFTLVSVSGLRTPIHFPAPLCSPSDCPDLVMFPRDYQLGLLLDLVSLPAPWNGRVCLIFWCYTWWMIRNIPDPLSLSALIGFGCLLPCDLLVTLQTILTTLCLLLEWLVIIFTWKYTWIIELDCLPTQPLSLLPKLWLVDQRHTSVSRLWHCYQSLYLCLLNNTTEFLQILLIISPFC